MFYSKAVKWLQILSDLPALADIIHNLGEDINSTNHWLKLMRMNCHYHSLIPVLLSMADSLPFTAGRCHCCKGEGLVRESPYTWHIIMFLPIAISKQAYYGYHLPLHY